jgi:hypothetical protein
MQAFPDAPRAFRNVGLRKAEMMHLEILIGAVAKKPRTTGPKIRETGDVLLGRQRARPMKMNRGHLKNSCIRFHTGSRAG